MTTERVLIVGAGIAGTTLRHALCDGPWQVELVDRGADWNRVGAGLAVQPNAMRALHSIGLGAAVERAGAALRSFEYRDQDDRTLCAIDLLEVWAGVGTFVGITRPALHDALGGECSGRGVVAVRRRGGRIAVTFGDGTEDTYDLVVGADGIHSRVCGCAGAASPV